MSTDPELGKGEGEVDGGVGVIEGEEAGDGRFLAGATPVIVLDGDTEATRLDSGLH